MEICKESLMISPIPNRIAMPTHPAYECISSTPLPSNLRMASTPARTQADLSFNYSSSRKNRTRRSTGKRRHEMPLRVTTSKTLEDKKAKRFDSSFPQTTSKSTNPVDVDKCVSFVDSKVKQPECFSLRRSKRVKLEKSQVGIYEFETITDFSGKAIIVPKLVPIRNKHEITDSVEQSNDVSGDKPAPSYSYNHELEDIEYKYCSPGVQMHEEQNGAILCLEPNGSTKTLKHVQDVFYVVRKGECSFSIQNSVTTHQAAEIIKIPASKLLLF